MFSVVCEESVPTFCWHENMYHWIFVYTASALGTILPSVLVCHPILVLYRAPIEVFLMLVNLVGCSMEVNSSVSDRNEEGKILAAF